jgi:hypothetical protein
MKSLSRAVSWSLVIMVMAGCASTDVTERQRYEGAQLTRPDRIIVHDFTANPAEVPPESTFAAEWPVPPCRRRSSSRSAASWVRRSRASW